MLDIINTPDSQTYQLVGTIAATGATPTIKITGDDPTLDIGATLPSELILHITPEIDVDGKSKSESFYVNTPIDNGDGTYSYTTVYRALKNNVSNNPPQASDSLGSGGYKLHTDGAAVIISPTTELRALKNTFTAGTTTESKEAGEALLIRESVSLHTDGKVYKYHNVNYPNFIGITNAGYSAGTTAVITTFNGVSTGHSTLTIGGNVYADNTGQVTQTATLTAKKVGVATSATTIRLSLVLDAVTEFSDADLEVFNDADGTKKIAFDASGNATGKTTTIKTNSTVDETFELPAGGGKALSTVLATVEDSVLKIDGGTGKLTFDASGLTADRALVVPNNAGTIALTSQLFNTNSGTLSGTATATTVTHTVTHNLGIIPKSVFIDAWSYVSVSGDKAHGHAIPITGCVYPITLGSNNVYAYYDGYSTAYYLGVSISNLTTTQLTVTITRSAAVNLSYSFKYLILA